MPAGISYSIFIEDLEKVETRYLHSQFIGHSTANDIFEHFCKSLETLDNAKSRQVAMDGPSTNWKFLDLLNRSRAAQQLPKLLNIESSSLHILHGAFKTGSEKASWEMKSVLKASFHFLHDTPARRDIFISVTDCSVFSLYFCATRWIEDSDVAK